MAEKENEKKVVIKVDKSKKAGWKNTLISNEQQEKIKNLTENIEHSRREDLEILGRQIATDNKARAELNAQQFIQTEKLEKLTLITEKNMISAQKDNEALKKIALATLVVSIVTMIISIFQTLKP